MSDGAQCTMQRLRALAKISDAAGQLTRTYGSPAMRRANELAGEWMRDAGMSVRTDAIGNLIGRYEGTAKNSKTFILGSHLDTVCNAGAFDGPLGVILGIECVSRLHTTGTRLPFALEVIGFCDEEGVRFHTTYLGSRALAGTLSEQDLRRMDEHGISLAEAIRAFGGNPNDLPSACRTSDELLGYAEVHIEQGPVLEARSLPVGIVSNIDGQTRARVRFLGRAGHAGTTPMVLRCDALIPAARYVLTVESLMRDDAELVATVGDMKVFPGASNVIPGEVNLTVDIRHPHDVKRAAAVTRLQTIAAQLQKETGVTIEWHTVQETRSIICSSELNTLLKEAAQSYVDGVIELPSGAGHDAAALSAITPVAMLFVRCKDGVSHHPDETATVEDIAVALNVMNDFIQLLARKYG